MPSPLRRRNALRSLAALAALSLATCTPSTISDTPVDVTSFDVSSGALSLNVGDSAQVSAVAKSATGVRLTGRAVSWSSGNASIVSVSSSGQVRAMGPGTTNVIASSGGASTNISVTVVARPHLALSSTAVAFTALDGTSDPPPSTVQITNSGAGSLGAITVASPQYNTLLTSGWLTVTLNTSVSPNVIVLQPSTSALNPGTYSATISVAATGADNTPQTISVTLKINAAVKLSIVGAGTGSGTVTGAGVSCTITGQGTSGTCSVLVASGSALNLTAAATGNSAFNGWADACTGTTATCTTVVLNTNRSVTAVFNPAGPTITVSGAGTGTGVVVGNGINCAIAAGVASGICQVTQPTNSSIQLTATPAGGTVFASWSGPCSGAGLCNFVLGANQSVVATFNVLPPAIGLSPAALSFVAAAIDTNPQTQNVAVSNSGGGTLNGLAIGTIQYAAGQPQGWLSASLDVTTAPATIAVKVTPAGIAAGTYTATIPITSPVASNSPRTVTVSLIVGATSTLAVALSGAANGTVTSSPGGISCSLTSGVLSGACTSTFFGNTNVTLTVTPAFRYASQWSGACSGTSTTCVLALPPSRAVGAQIVQQPTILQTGSASGITTTSATISGTVFQDGAPYTVFFEWGTTTALGSRSGNGSGPSPSCPGTVNCNWTLGISVTTGTTVFYRIGASNGAGSSSGAILSFKVP